MLFRELKELDKVHAFDAFVTMQFMLDNMVDDYYKSIFKTHCQCGSEMIIQVNKRRFMCCDPRCVYKMGHRLNNMFKSFGCKGIGEQTCKDVAEYAFSYANKRSNIELLCLTQKEMPDLGFSRSSTYIQCCIKARQTPMTFPVMMSRLEIPGFDATARSLFEGISNCTEMADRIEEAGGIINFFNSRGVYDLMKIFHFAYFLEDIAYAEQTVFKALRSIGAVKMSIVMTGVLWLGGERITKADFVERCNQITVDGVRLFEIEDNKAIQTTNYLISSYSEESPGTWSASVRAAKEREIFEGWKEAGRKLIYTPDEFLSYLEGVAESCKNRLEETNKSQETDQASI